MQVLVFSGRFSPYVPIMWNRQCQSVKISAMSTAALCRQTPCFLFYASINWKRRSRFKNLRQVSVQGVSKKGNRALECYSAPNI